MRATAIKTLVISGVSGAVAAAALAMAPTAAASPAERCAVTPNLGFCDTVSRVNPDRPHGNFMYGPYGNTPPVGD